MFRENVVRYFLLMRHVFTSTPALFSHKRKTYTNKFDFLLLSIPDGRLGVIYFFESFEVFIQLETTRNFRYMKIHIFALRWKDEIRRSSQLRTLLKLVVVSRT